jgi:hypothetical protein
MKAFILAGTLALAGAGLTSVLATPQGPGAPGAAAVNMTAPAPRLANGKPSMTGVWDNTRRADVTNPARVHGGAIVVWDGRFHADCRARG